MYPIERGNAIYVEMDSARYHNIHRNLMLRNIPYYESNMNNAGTVVVMDCDERTTKKFTEGVNDFPWTTHRDQDTLVEILIDFIDHLGLSYELIQTRNSPPTIHIFDINMGNYWDLRMLMNNMHLSSGATKVFIL